MAKGSLFIVSAPSGGGKTSLTRALVPRLSASGIEAVISVSYTTRAPRAGEQDGTHYHFVDEPSFVRMADRGEFLEHAEVFGRRYGTGRERTEQLRAAGRDVILDIDWQGARQVRRSAADIVSIFILPPSLAELERRLRERSQDDEDVIARRMRAAREEMSHYNEYDHVVVNDVFEQALEQLAAVFIARRTRLDGQAQRLAPLIADLLAK